jgi:hypothetical protein
MSRGGGREVLVRRGGKRVSWAFYGLWGAQFCPQPAFSQPSPPLANAAHAITAR